MARGIKPDKAFSDEFERILPDPDIRKAIMMGIVATIAANPRVGIPNSDAPDSLWYIFLTDAPAWGFGQLILHYSFDDAELRLHWIG